MRPRLTPDTLLLGVVLLMTLGIAIYAVSSGHAQQDEALDRRTTYSSRPGGYQALFEAMQRLRLPVRRWRRPLDALTEAGTLVVAEPESPLAPAEWQALAGWVAEGNLLIYLSDHTRLLEELFEPAQDHRFAAVPPEPPEQAARPVQPAPPAGAAPDLRTQTAYYLPAGDWAAPAGRTAPARGSGRRDTPDLLAEPAVPLYQDPHGVAVSCTRWGRGTVIQCSSPWSLSTAGVDAGDNFVWLLSTMEAYAPRTKVRGQGSERQGSGVRGQGAGANRPESSLTPDPQPLTPVLFDEYHHGYGEARGVLSLLAPIARLGLAQLVIAWLLLLFTVSRRFGGRVPEEGRVRRSRSEYLGSMASLLGRARAADLAVDQMRRQFLYDATYALGLPRDAALPALLAAAGTRGVDPERLRVLLEQTAGLAADRDRARQEDILALARELARIRSELTRSS